MPQFEPNQPVIVDVNGQPVEGRFEGYGPLATECSVLIEGKRSIVKLAAVTAKPKADAAK